MGLEKFDIEDCHYMIGLAGIDASSLKYSMDSHRANRLTLSSPPLPNSSVTGILIRIDILCAPLSVYLPLSISDFERRCTVVIAGQ